MYGARKDPIGCAEWKQVMEYSCHGWQCVTKLVWDWCFKIACSLYTSEEEFECLIIMTKFTKVCDVCSCGIILSSRLLVKQHVLYTQTHGVDARQYAQYQELHALTIPKFILTYMCGQTLRGDKYTPTLTHRQASVNSSHPKNNYQRLSSSLTKQKSSSV